MTHLLTEKRDRVGLITLARPTALNALDLGMIEGIAATLDAWEQDADVEIIAFRAEGRAFCAGGDIKAIHALGRDNRADQLAFFAAEYALNRRLYHYPKPTVALMHGITMGGGFGIAGNCTHRVVREDSTFAMPEVGIGFFPDVGSAWHLGRMPDRAGFYLGLTGLAVDAGDMLFCGAATAFVPAMRWDALLADLAADGVAAIERHAAAPYPAGETLRVHRGEIALIFGDDGPPDTEFARHTRAVIAQASCASVALAAAHIAMAAGEAFDTVTARDLDLARLVLGRDDFYEGVRAALVDKDKRPVWTDPAVLPLDMRPPRFIIG